MERTIRSDKLIIAANQNPKEKEYWLNQLSGEWVKNHFPYDHKKSANERWFKEVKFRFDGELFSALMALCKNSQYKLHIIMAAVLTAFVNKYTGSEDVVIGTPIYKQKTEGDFVNTVLVLRNQVDDNMTFKELILNMKDVIVKATENRNYPVEILSHQLNMPFSEDNDFPLFDIAILMENIHDKGYIQYLNCNIIFSFLKTNQCIEGILEYNSSLYEEVTINRIIDYFTHLLQEAVLKVDAEISETSILSKEKRRQILFEFNRTKKEIARDKCYYQLFEEVVSREPWKTVTKHNERHISCNLLKEEAGEIARFLSEYGVTPNSIVALYLKRSIKMQASIIGVFKVGGAYLPLEVDWPGTRVQYILENSEADIVITDTERLENLQKLQTPSSPFKHILCLHHDKRFETTETTTRGSDCERTGKEIHPGNLAYMIYTSGTTGKPKGVMIHQLGMINHMYAKINDLSITANDIIAQTASACFDISVWQFLAGLLVGSKTLVIDRDIVLEFQKFLKVLQEEKVTILESVPSLMSAFLKTAANESNNRLNHLRWMIPTGEPLSAPLAREWYRLYPGITLLNAYGPTEASDDVTHYIVKEVSSEDQTTIPIGRPLQNLHIYIMDKKLSLCPIGVRGEVCVAGIGVGKGYWKDSRKTGYSFVPNPYLEEIGDMDYALLYRTGDVGYFREDGNIECLGRLDFQVKIRGNRIELGEIENQLLKHQHIKSAVVIVIETGKPEGSGSDGGGKKLCAYVISDEVIEPAELKKFLSRDLPDYMIPSCFVQIDSIPLTANGKLNRKALPAPGSEEGETVTPPQNEIEYKLAEIWSEILGLERETLGRDHNFFQLGGHSLSANILISRIHKELNVKLPLVEIFKAQTIRRLSECIKGAVKDLYMSIEPAETKEYYPLSSAQKRLFILSQMDKESVAYNESLAVLIEGDLDKNKLEESFKALIQKHENLRTSIAMIEHEPFQRVHGAVEFGIEYFKGDEKGLESLIKTFIRPFTMDKAPFLRVGLVEIGEARHVLLLDMHHIITDWASFIIFVNDLVQYYTGGELPALTLQYKDYAEWQSSAREKEKVKRQEEYWLNKFRGEISLLNLPLDYPRSIVENFDGDTISFELEGKLSRKLEQLAKEEDATVFVVLLAAYNILLSKYTGQEDIIVGAPIEGRTHPDLENMIGMFVNMLPMRNRLVKEKPFSEFLSEVKENAFKDFENQDYQFEELVHKLELPRIPGRNPLVETVLLYQTPWRSVDERVQTGVSGLTLRNYENEMGIAKFDLILTAYEGGEFITIRMTYSTVLFKRATVEKMTQRYVDILRQVIENKDIKLHEIILSHDLLIAKPDIAIEDQGEFAF